ncbi:MAG: FMN-binding protein [Acidobacteriota bacterium]
MKSRTGLSTRSSRRRRRTSAAALAFLLILAAPAAGKVFLTQQEALRLAFPAGVSVERRTAFLSEAELQEARKLARSESPPAALVTYYVGVKDGRTVATAYFDTHVVRTQPETIMVVVDPAGSVLRVEVLSFLEPEDYLPLPRWYGLFAGRPLDDELSSSRAIRPVAGATLTVRATTEAVRRVLAVHRVIGASASP